MKIAIVTLIALIFVALAVPAAAESGVGGTFIVGGYGTFNGEIEDYSIASRSVTSPAKQVPLSADLDGDNVTELIVRDASTLRLYQGKTLSPIIAHARPASSSLSNLLLHDLDDDGNPEIIEVLGTTISIMSFNGTAISNYSLSWTDGNYSDGGSMVSCNGQDECLAVYSTYATSSTAARLMGVRFNATEVSVPKNIYNPGFQTMVCMPSIPYMTAADYDRDGVTEFVFSTAYYQSVSANLRVHLDWVSVESGLPVVEHSALFSSSDVISGSTCAGSKMQTQFNAPLVYDTDTDAGTGDMEAIVAIIYTNANAFRLYRYGSDGTLLGSYPSAILDGCAAHLSNMFIGDAFSTITSFCAVGFSASGCSGAQELLCGNALTTWSVGLFDYNYRLFRYPYSEQTENLSFTQNSGNEPYRNIVYSVYMDSSTNGSLYNYRELSTFEGIERLGDTGDDILEPLFRTEKTNETLTFANLEGKTRPELVMMTKSNIYYFTDSFENTLPELGDVTFNPCYTSPIKINSTMLVSMAVSDGDATFEGDQVAARAQLYLGETFEQDSGWSSYQDSGTDFPFYFSANVSSVSSVLRLSWRDSAEPASVQTKDYAISVAANGVSFGVACTETAAEAAAAENTTEDIFGATKGPLADNALSASIANTAKTTGLGTTLVWYILMLALAILIFFGAVQMEVKGPDMRYIYILIAFCELALLIIGTKLGFVGVGVIISLVVLGIIVVAVMLSRRAMPN